MGHTVNGELVARMFILTTRDLSVSLCVLWSGIAGRYEPRAYSTGASTLSGTALRLPCEIGSTERLSVSVSGLRSA